MDITEQEYAAVAEDILATLKKHKIDSQARDEVLAIVESLKSEIVGV